VCVCVCVSASLLLSLREIMCASMFVEGVSQSFEPGGVKGWRSWCMAGRQARGVAICKAIKPKTLKHTHWERTPCTTSCSCRTEIACKISRAVLTTAHILGAIVAGSNPSRYHPFSTASCFHRSPRESLVLRTITKQRFPLTG
jgi:hypothetical protein